MSRVRVVFRDNPVLTLNRKRAAEVLFRGKMLEPPKREASRFTEAFDQHENTILHVCEMILQVWGRETDLSLVMSALSNVVPALKMWGKFLDLLYRVNSDDIDIEQFETLCKMLKWSVGMGFASSSMGFKNGKGCTQAICGCVTATSGTLIELMKIKLRSTHTKRCERAAMGKYRFLFII